MLAIVLAELEQFEDDFDPGNAPIETSQNADLTAVVKRRKISRACDVCRKRKGDFIQLPTGNLDKCLNCFSAKIDCTFSDGSKPRKTSKGYVEALEKKVERSEKLLELLCPNAEERERLLSGDVDELPGEDHGDDPSVAPIITSRNPMTALTKMGSVSAIELTVAGIRTHVNRRGENAEDVVHDDDDLADIRQLCNRLTLNDEEYEEAFHIQKHYLGKSSGRHFLRKIIDLKEMHKHDFSSNATTAAETESDAGSDNEICLLDTQPQIPRRRAPFLGSRRPEYWKVLPWERKLLRIRPTIVDPQFQEFPEPDLMKTLIHHYFKQINIEMPLLHRPTFEKHIADGMHKMNSTFGAVVLLVCALGSRYSDDPRVQLSEEEIDDSITLEVSEAEMHKEKPRRRNIAFSAPYSRGWKYFPQAWESQQSFSVFLPPTLYDLYFYALAGQYFLRGSSSTWAAWQLIGIGIRLAQEVGAHRKRSVQDTPMDKDTVRLEELWKRAAWVLITIDRILGSAKGRPCALHDEDFDLDLPIECDDEYWDNPNPELRFKQPEGKPSLITAFALTIRFNQIMEITIRTIYSIDKTKVLMGMVHEWEHRVVSEIDSALNQWLDSIPPHLRWDSEQPNDDFFRHSTMLYSSYYYVQILAHRPFIPAPKKPSTSSFPSLAICTNAARSLIQIGVAYTERIGDVTAYMPLHLLSASIVLLLRIWHSHKSGTLTEQQYQKDMEGVNSCLKILRMAEKRSISWGRIWDILSSLVVVNEVHVRPNIGRHTAQKNKSGNEDPAQRSSGKSPGEGLMPGASSTFPSLPVYPASPFTDPAMSPATNPAPGSYLGGFNPGPTQQQCSGFDGSQHLEAGSRSPSSFFNGFSSAASSGIPSSPAITVPGPLSAASVSDVTVTPSADSDTQGMARVLSPAVPVDTGPAAPHRWLNFAAAVPPANLPQQQQRQTFSTMPFLEGFGNPYFGREQPLAGPSSEGTGVFSDYGSQSFERLHQDFSGTAGLFGSLVFPMLGQPGANGGFATQDDIDMMSSNGLGSSIFADNFNVGSAPFNGWGSYLKEIAELTGRYEQGGGGVMPQPALQQEEYQHVFGGLGGDSSGFTLRGSGGAGSGYSQDPR